MAISDLIIPLLFILIIGGALKSRVNVFSSFTRGVGEGIQFVFNILPMLAAIFMMCQLFEDCGLSATLSNFLKPAFSFLGIPPELSKLILIKPFSGSGSLTYLTNIINEYGADSYIGRCACVCYGSSETVFYVSAIYFAKTRQKTPKMATFIVLFSIFFSVIVACGLCKIM